MTPILQLEKQSQVWPNPHLSAASHFTWSTVCRYPTTCLTAAVHIGANEFVTKQPLAKGFLTSCWPLGPHPAYWSFVLLTSGGYKFWGSLKIKRKERGEVRISAALIPGIKFYKSQYPKSYFTVYLQEVVCVQRALLTIPLLAADNPFPAFIATNLQTLFLLASMMLITMQQGVLG